MVNARASRAYTKGKFSASFQIDANANECRCPCFVDDDEEDNAYPIAEIDSRLSALDELMIGGTEEEEEQTMEQTCFKSDDSVRKDTSKWRWVGRDVAARRIEEFCSLDFKDDAATREYTDGDDGRDSLKISVSYKGIDPPSRDTCIFNLRDKILDGCDHDDRLNQFNLKWGGRRTESPSGLEFTLQPIHERVATKSPNWECNVWKTREDKNNKGKDGKNLPELVDDKMMKEMCVHEAWYRGWTDINCGGSYNIDMNGSVSTIPHKVPHIAPFRHRLTKIQSHREATPTHKTAGDTITHVCPMLSRTRTLP